VLLLVEKQQGRQDRTTTDKRKPLFICRPSRRVPLGNVVCICVLQYTILRRPRAVLSLASAAHAGRGRRPAAAPTLARGGGGGGAAAAAGGAAAAAAAARGGHTSYNLQVELRLGPPRTYMHAFWYS
jgi:hypothetical protein